MPSEIDKSSIVPVAMLKQDSGSLAARVLRPIEIAGDKKTGHAFEKDFLDRVITLVEPAVNDSVERRPLRQRPNPFRNRDLPPNLLSPLGPFLLGLGHRQRKVELGRAHV